APRDAVELAHRDPRADRGERRLLRAEHEVVDRLLAWRELPVDRESPRDVGGVLAPLGRGIDDDQVAVFGAAAVDGVGEPRGGGAGRGCGPGGEKGTNPPGGRPMGGEPPPRAPPPARTRTSPGAPPASRPRAPRR